jgi:micrococcal nuclease
MSRFYYTPICAILLVLGMCLFFPPTAAAEEYLVTRVLDGRTITIKARSFIGIPIENQNVRLLAIDAPELKQEPWGARSKRNLKTLLSRANWFVRLEFDEARQDKNGLLQAYVWTRKGQFINERMVLDGFAVAAPAPPNMKYAERLDNAQQQAMSSHSGMWGKDRIKELPAEWRQHHPGK